jgi:hypothetical protein
MLNQGIRAAHTLHTSTSLTPLDPIVRLPTKVCNTGFVFFLLYLQTFRNELRNVRLKLRNSSSRGRRTDRKLFLKEFGVC